MMTGPVVRCMSLILVVWLADDSTAFQYQHQIQKSPSVRCSRFRDNVPRVFTVPVLSATTAEEGDEAKTTSFTLSFGDVEFCLTPDDTTNDAEMDVMSISKISNGEVSIHLNNFSGQLQVKNLNAIIDDGDVDDVNGGAEFEEVEEVDAPPEVEEVEEVEAPPTQPQSKAAIKFDKMLSNFLLHSEADFNLVPSPRYRGLLKGTSAAIADPEVIQAFRVLYEDVGPIRVAGDLIFSKLEREVAKSKGTDGAAAVQALGREDACVVAARKVFDAVDADASGTISSQELLKSDLLRSLGQCSECTCEKEGSCQSVMRFMDEIDKTHPKGELHFDEFLLASHQLLYEGDASVSLFGGDDCAEELVDEILNGMEGVIGKEKMDRYSKRFDNMCAEFDSWDSESSSSKAESSNPRLALVLEGCFAGSRNPPVVDALKILYIDFRPLRMAGDLIFKMMRKLARG